MHVLLMMELVGAHTQLILIGALECPAKVNFGWRILVSVQSMVIPSSALHVD